MALIDRQVRDRITSRGLGDLTLATDAAQVSFGLNVKGEVYIDRYYYPTTGVYSTEESIEGWKWDITNWQLFNDNTPGKENTIESSIGGYNYNLLDNIPETYYRGSIVNGCELVGIKDLEGSWNPEINTGVYSLQGKERKVFPNESFCKIFSSETIDLNEYASLANLDNVVVAMYERKEDFSKNIYREYKEDNAVFKYSVSNNSFSIDSERYFQVGNKNAIFGDTKKSWEKISGPGSGTRTFYTKYFPINNISLRQKTTNGFLAIDEVDYKFDADLGVVSVDSNITGEIYIAYVVLPRIDIELKTFDKLHERRLDLKSHKWGQSNILVELSTEDKNVAKLELSANLTIGQSLKYGEDVALVKAIALDARDNVVDEIEVNFECLDNKQEVRYEGNLLRVLKITNSSGEAFTLINAPLSTAASSYLFQKNDAHQFSISSEEIANGEDIQNKAITFEVLKVDPLFGSTGLALEAVWEQSSRSFKVVQNLESSDYSIYRNLMTNIRETDNDCFKIVYNSGILAGVIHNRNFYISKVDSERVYLGGDIRLTDGGTYNIKIFKRNEKESTSIESSSRTSQGLERVLYESQDGSLKLLKPDTVSNGLLTYTKLQNRLLDDLVIGYRIFIPRKTRLQAKCIDPATGITIYSNILEVNTELPEIYKSHLELDGDQSTIDIGNFLSYSPVDGSKIYFEVEP